MTDQTSPIDAATIDPEANYRIVLARPATVAGIKLRPRGDITLRGDTKTFLGDSLYLDVFPATLDEFVSLAWDSRFGPQMDHDGDGLLATPVAF